jgi:hypothetical protein
MLNFSTSFLLANLLWGSVGFGYIVYGKAQRNWVPFLGGVLMIAASFISSALIMSLISIGIMAAVYYMVKQGY